MKLKYLIPSLIAAGLLPANSVAIAALPRESDDAKSASLFDIFKREHRYNLAAHGSHASHGSHGSHRSSGGGGVYRPPAPAPAPRLYSPTPAPRLYSPTPPSSILPEPPAAPRTLPGNSAKFREIVIQLQTCLSLFGYTPGPINGQVGPETAAAISKFQEQWSFAITGTVTPEVLDACGITAQ